VAVRRLELNDIVVLHELARDAEEFDVEGRTDSVAPLDEESARTYLSNPDVLHWVADEGSRVDGFLLCYVQYKWHAPSRELMLYEIGVRQSTRGKGIGRQLIEAMEEWMTENQIADVWVLADNPGAESFYAACGFERDEEQAVMMSKVVSGRTNLEQQ
jgi:ribosomal protein S18 acetylase RimI-like enzyme